MQGPGVPDHLEGTRRRVLIRRARGRNRVVRAVPRVAYQLDAASPAISARGPGYRTAVLGAVQFLCRLQFLEPNTRHFETSFRASMLIGAVHLSPTDGTLRIDATACARHRTAAVPFLRPPRDRKQRTEERLAAKKHKKHKRSTEEEDRVSSRQLAVFLLFLVSFCAFCAFLRPSCDFLSSVLCSLRAGSYNPCSRPPRATGPNTRRIWNR